MIIGKVYPVCMNIARRDVDFETRPENYDNYGDFDLEITLRDDASRRKFLTLMIPAGRLMAALGNRAEVPCTIEFENNFLQFGKSKETKTVWIREQKKVGVDKVPSVPKKYTDAGWVYSHGYGNTRVGELRDGAWHYPCTLHRWVDEETEIEEVEE